MSCWCFHLNKLEVKYSTGCFQKSGGKLPPKMDGENSGSKPYEQMDDLGGKPPPPIFGSTPNCTYNRNLFLKSPSSLDIQQG